MSNYVGAHNIIVIANFIYHLQDTEYEVVVKSVISQQFNTFMFGRRYVSNFQTREILIHNINIWKLNVFRKL